MTYPLLPSLTTKVDELISRFDEIAPERRTLLGALVDELRPRIASRSPISLNFICTHNSRRSQLGQVWAAVAALAADVPKVQTFSGGTEETAFNPRAVEALRRAGFSITEGPTRSVPQNPRYSVEYSAVAPPLECFSKVFDAPENPTQDFLAIITCGEADAHCPMVPGAKRIPLLYEDPKKADDTPLEKERYDERSNQIGRELLWAFFEARHQ